MKVTDYYPIIYATDIEAEIKRYTEDLRLSTSLILNSWIMRFLKMIIKDALISFARIFLRTHSRRVSLVCA